MARTAPSTDPTANLAYTMLGEANPGNVAGMTAVGNTVLNRLAAGGYGKTITDVVTGDDQYAAWGIGTVAASQVAGLAPLNERFPPGSAAYQQAYGLAQQIIDGETQDPTGGALNYRATADNGQWSQGAPGTVTIDGNTFQTNHPVSAGTQLIATDPTVPGFDASAYGSAYGWSSLPDANAPTSPADTQTASTSTPDTAADAIADATEGLPPGTNASNANGSFQDLGYTDSDGNPSATPVPLAQQQQDAGEGLLGWAAGYQPGTPPPSTATAASDQDTIQQGAPLPENPPATVSSSQADQIALANVKQFLQGSNVNLDNVPADQQVALMKAVPQLVAMQNDPKALLQYLSDNNLTSALTDAVPSSPPNFAEKMWAGANGVTLPGQIPNALSTWGLSTGSDPNAAASAIQNALAQAQGTRVASANPMGPTQWAAPAIAAINGSSTPAAPPASSSSSTPAYQIDAHPGEDGLPGLTAADAPNLGWDAYTNPTTNGNVGSSGSSSGNNSLASWSQPYTSSPTAVSDGSSYTPPSSGSSGNNSLASWSQPYISSMGAIGDDQYAGLPSAQQQISDMSAAQYDTTSGSDIASLGISPSVNVPQYTTISKQIQVPSDQPIEQGSAGITWVADPNNPDGGSYQMTQPTQTAPQMVTKTITQKVVNPVYTAQVAAQQAAQQQAAAAAAAKAAALAQMTPVQQLQASNPNLSSAQAYNSLAAQTLATQNQGPTTQTTAAPVTGAAAHQTQPGSSSFGGGAPGGLGGN